MIEAASKVNREGAARARAGVASALGGVMVAAPAPSVSALPPPPAEKPTTAWTLWLPPALLLAAAAAVLLSGAHRWLSMEAIAVHKAHLAAAVDRNALLALAAYVALYVAVIALSIPGSLLMTFAGGVLFPFWVAAPAVVVSATAGATILFLVVRSSLGAALARRGGPTVARIAEGFRTDAVPYLLFLRLVPLFPFALVNLAAALAAVPLRTFVWTTFFGIMPASFAFTFAAVSLGDVLDDRTAAFEACRAAARQGCTLAIEPSMLVSPKLLAAFAVLGLLALAPAIARRLGFGAHRRG